MRYCPNCGKELEEGVTRCWNPGCDFVLGTPNKLDDMTLPVVKSERQKKMELEYELARMGLSKGLTSTILVLISGLFSLLATAVVLVMSNRTLLTGNQLVIIFGILAVAIIIYFAFVFGRAARIKAELDKEKKQIEIEAGKKVR